MMQLAVCIHTWALGSTAAAKRVSRLALSRWLCSRACRLLECNSGPREKEPNIRQTVNRSAREDCRPERSSFLWAVVWVRKRDQGGLLLSLYCSRIFAVHVQCVSCIFKNMFQKR